MCRILGYDRESETILRLLEKMNRQLAEPEDELFNRYKSFFICFPPAEIGAMYVCGTLKLRYFCKEHMLFYSFAVITYEDLKYERVLLFELENLLEILAQTFSFTCSNSEAKWPLRSCFLFTLISNAS